MWGGGQVTCPGFLISQGPRLAPSLFSTRGADFSLPVSDGLTACVPDTGGLLGDFEGVQTNSSLSRVRHLFQCVLGKVIWPIQLITYEDDIRCHLKIY